MSFTPVDLHAHTTFSDGVLSVEELISNVNRRGVRPSVADHVSGDVRGALRGIDDIRRYLDALERHDVLRGAEFCWHCDVWREVPPEVDRRFTHTLGSLHGVWLPNGELMHAFSSPWPAGLDPQAYMDIHVENLEKFAGEITVDVLAHPTLLPMALRKIPLEELWTEAREERAVAALGRAGIAFEISNRYRPHERFVRRAVDSGLRVSLGSDGHVAEQVGDVAWPLALARRVGVPDDALYDPLVHGRRADRA